MTETQPACCSHSHPSSPVHASLSGFAQKYLCPMCPGIESNHPKACPKCGMDLEPVGLPNDFQEAQEIQTLRNRFLLSLLFTLPVFALAMGSMTGNTDDTFFRWISPQLNGWLQLIFSFFVVFGAGRLFFVRGWQSILNRSPNMYTLIMMSIGASYLYSVLAILTPQLFPDNFRHHGQLSLYFESGAVIITLILLGQFLESKARKRTGDAIQSLIKLSAKNAWRITQHEGQTLEEEVPVEELQPGDILRIRPGESIPVDGLITEGEGQINESMLTGEALPVRKKSGDPIIGATLNETGSFLMKVERTGTQTVLSQMIHLVSKAQRSQPPIQALADQVSAFFVPTIFLIAVITFFSWSFFGPTPALAFGFANAFSVLIIACPCALGLATPLSIIVGMGQGAKLGLLIRNARAIEQSEKITHLVIDKTGTLTEGRPTVSNKIPYHTDEKTLIRLAAALEYHSEHPIGRAIVHAFNETHDLDQRPVIKNFTSITGCGIQGEWENSRIRVGKRTWLESLSTPLPDELIAQSESLEEMGHTVVWVSRNNKLLGIISVSDPIKATTPKALKKLHQQGIQIIMCTGDSLKTATATANHPEIRPFLTELHAELSPEDKQTLVKQLKDQGAIIAMAGDGINDAPALAEAHLGIAMGTGTDIAIESADITLLKGDLQGINKVLILSRAVMSNIRQNLFFAFAYNLLGVPIAAGVLYPQFGLLLDPMFAGGAMALSSLCVVSNALRLQSIKLN